MADKDFRESTTGTNRGSVMPANQPGHSGGGAAMPLLREMLGGALRARRQEQSRTLREVSQAARVSLGYLSEVERGQKEASSELLQSICDALEVSLAQLLRDVSDDLALAELTANNPMQVGRTEFTRVESFQTGGNGQSAEPKASLSSFVAA
jgi:transcriptional regulator with XRE-family HTH domain